MTLLQELKRMSTECDSEYTMFKWLEAHKEELNKLGVWVKKEEN